MNAGVGVGVAVGVGVGPGGGVKIEVPGSGVGGVVTTGVGQVRPIATSASVVTSIV